MNIFSLLRFIVSHPLNRQAKLAALGRFVRWQVSSRLMGEPIALPYVEGTRLLATNGMTGATANYYCGLHEVTEMSFVLHALRPGDFFADIGANIGSYSVLAAGAAGTRVISVEPVPATFKHLMDNIRLNDLSDRVEAICCGLSSQSGELQFVSSLDTMNRVALPGEDLPTVTVPVRTLNDICGTSIPAIIKIDVEGHEKPVLEGGSDTLANEGVRAVLMETNQSGEKFGVSDAELMDIMARHGFEPCDYAPFERTLKRQTKPQSNTIFVRDIAAMNAHCAASHHYSLINGSI